MRITSESVAKWFLEHPHVANFSAFARMIGVDDLTSAHQLEILSDADLQQLGSAQQAWDAGGERRVAICEAYESLMRSDKQTLS